MRTLTLISLTFGLAATGALLLAVATDYWLYTSEPMDFENMVMEVCIMRYQSCLSVILYTQGVGKFEQVRVARESPCSVEDPKMVGCPMF